MKGRDTLSTVAVSVRGAVRKIGKERLNEIFEQNPYMAKIYPTEKSRDALEVFQLYKWESETCSNISSIDLKNRRRFFSGLPAKHG